MQKSVICGFSQEISYVELKSTPGAGFIATQSTKQHLKKLHSQNSAVRAHLGKKEAKEEVALLQI